MEPHQHPVTRPERKLWMRFDRVAWLKLQAEMLRDRSEHELRFYHCEAEPDALSRPAAERNVGVT